MHRARGGPAAAQAKHQAGAPDAALALLATAEAGPLDEAARAQAHLLRAHVALVHRGRFAPGLLLEAARRLELHDPALASETHVDAILAAQALDRLATRVGADLAHAAEAGLRLGASPRDAVPHPLLDGFAALFSEGYAEAVPKLRRALVACRSGGLTDVTELRWPGSPPTSPS